MCVCVCVCVCVCLYRYCLLGDMFMLDYIFKFLFVEMYNKTALKKCTHLYNDTQRTTKNTSAFDT